MLKRPAITPQFPDLNNPSQRNTTTQQLRLYVCSVASESLQWKWSVQISRSWIQLTDLSKWGVGTLWPSLTAEVNCSVELGLLILENPPSRMSRFVVDISSSQAGSHPSWGTWQVQLNCLKTYRWRWGKYWVDIQKSGLWQLGCIQGPPCAVSQEVPLINLSSIHNVIHQISPPPCHHYNGRSWLLRCHSSSSRDAIWMGIKSTRLAFC